MLSAQVNDEDDDINKLPIIIIIIILCKQLWLQITILYKNNLHKYSSVPI